MTAVRDVMTPDPYSLSTQATVTVAARAMRDQGTATIVVEHDRVVAGIVTAFDLVACCLADEHDPHRVRLQDIRTEDVVTIGPDDPLDHAVQLMRRHGVRRLAVIEHGRPIGTVCLGDVADATVAR